jgi:hypothetical protein
MIAAGLFGDGTPGGGGPPPTDPYFSSVILLASFEGADESTTFTDYSGSPGTLTGGGGAKIDTARYGGGSLLLNGSSSGSRVSFSKNCNIGTGQFTLEAYIRGTAAQTGRIFSAQNSSTPNAVAALRVDAAGSLTSLLRNSAGTGLQVLTSATGLVATNDTTEHHVAWTRDASNLVTIWLDGVSVASGTSATNPNASRPYYLGALDNTQERFAGSSRWERITEGVCRYAATFTPPSMPFPTS